MNKHFRPEFWHIPTIVSDHPKIQAFDEKVYAVIHWFYKMKDGKCIASNQTIAEIIKPSDPQIRSVQNSLNHLEDYGFINRVFKDKNRRHRQEIIPLVSYKLERTTDDSQKQNEPQMIPERTTDDSQNEPQMTITIIHNKNRNYNNISEQSSHDIQELFDVFYKSINPTINFGNKTSRKSAQDLIKQFGKEMTIKMAQYACKIHGQKFAPTISTPYQLKEKLSALKAYAQKQKSKTPMVVEI